MKDYVWMLWHPSLEKHVAAVLSNIAFLKSNCILTFLKAPLANVLEFSMLSVNFKFIHLQYLVVNSVTRVCNSGLYKC